MALVDPLRKYAENQLWKWGLTPQRGADQRQFFTVQEYPDWQIRCHQTRRWPLWVLFKEARAENPDPSGFLALITVDRRDGTSIATFELKLLEAWIEGQSPRVTPRRKRRAGFAHHRLLQISKKKVHLLFSAQERQPALVSVSLDIFKQWLKGFPAPQRTQETGGQQLAFPLWHADSQLDQAKEKSPRREKNST